MEQIIEKLGWKKMALIIAGVSLLFFLLMIFEIIQKNKEMGGDGNVKTEPVTKSDTPGSFSVPEAQKLKDNYYSIEYPAYYNITREPQNGALEYTVLKDRVSNAQIKITVYDASANALEKVELPYINAGYEPESYPINGHNVDEFVKIDEGNGRLFQKTDFIKKDGKIIKLDFTYSGSEPDFEAERDFIRMLSSLK